MMKKDKRGDGWMDIYEKISDRVAELTPQLTAWRRDLHHFPEPAWREIRTCSIIAAHLEGLGYDVIAGQPVFDADARMGLPGADILDEDYERAIRQGVDPAWAERFKDGFTGVIGILYCGEGPTVAMRFDIDGLLLQETENENHFPNIHGFRSENEGVMHACGHDAHIVFGLGTARILAEMKENLHGTVKLIFQPAEEGVQGARAIVAKGHLDDVDVLIGSHVTEQDGFGSDVTPGSEGFLATTKMDVVFRGVAAHAGASPQTGSNAILAAATAVLNLHAISGTARARPG
jgi:aminobenzoyl-glutamate utilization protein A